MAGILSISSCCGVSLETGALIIGFISVLLEMPMIVYFIINDLVSVKFIATFALFCIDISWVLGIYRKLPVMMLTSLCVSIIVALMATFLVLSLSWAYILTEFGLFYYEHVIKYKISDSDEVIIFMLSRLFDKFSRITDDEASLVAELVVEVSDLSEKFHMFWFSVFVLTLISWYIVAVKHSIYNVMVRLETETEKNHNNGCNGTQKQQLMELISDNKSIVNS